MGHPDLTAVIASPRATSAASTRSAVSCPDPRAVPARPRRVHAQHAAAQPARTSPPTTTSATSDRADARPHAHVLVRRLRAPRRDARGGLAKLEMVCEKLGLGPRDHVLEIGTGWGGFAVYAATTRGCKVTTTTISNSTTSPSAASRRPASSTSSTCGSTTIADLRGSYDKLVSLEMIEAVGWKDFGTFFERCSDLRRQRDDAAPGDHDGRPRLSGREGVQELHPHLRLPRRLPALARGDLQVRRQAHRHAHRSPRGPHAPLRRDAAALAGELRGGDRRAGSYDVASAACGGCTSATARRASRAPDRARADRARQPLAGIDALAEAPPVASAAAAG